MEITSVLNDKVKFWQKLKQKKYRDQSKLFLVEDSHLVEEAIKTNYAQEIITTDRNLEFNLPTYYVTDKIMNLISTQETGAKIIAVCSFIPEKEIEGNIILLDNLQDPGNLGTIIRSAVAFNFKTLVLSKDSVDCYNPKVIRSCEGMIFHLNIIRTDLISFLQNLDASYLKITTNVKKGEDIRNIIDDKCAIVIGNEGHGVRNEISTLCDKEVNLSISKNCESLNAGVCASILMYEVNHE